VAELPPERWPEELQSQLAQSRRLLRDLQVLAAQSAELAKHHAELARQHAELMAAIRRLKR